MISKLVVWGQDREKARVKTISALENYSVHGIKTNISYLLQVLKNEAYINNKISTKYCDEHTNELIENIELEKNQIDKNIPGLAPIG